MTSHPLQVALDSLTFFGCRQWAAGSHSFPTEHGVYASKRLALGRLLLPSLAKQSACTLACDLWHAQHVQFAAAPDASTCS
jgi:hypothetical protein